MDIMEILHARMQKHIVTIRIRGGNVGARNLDAYDGIVLSSQQNCLYIIASSMFREKIDNSLIQVQLPNGRLITIQGDCFDMVANDDESGIVGIRCNNPTPNANCGFEDLEPIRICEDPVQERQKVYTYSHHSRQKLLTPGSIMLVQEDSFDHDCIRYLKIDTGTPVGTSVINVQGQLLGFNFSHNVEEGQLKGFNFTFNGYFTSYNMREVAARIERNQGRELKTIAVTFQHLRQQCRVLEFRLRALDVECKIQRIGEPVALAAWVNLQDFQQQHEAFQVEEEIQNEIEQYIWQAVNDRRAGLGYVRRNRRTFISRGIRL